MRRNAAGAIAVGSLAVVLGLIIVAGGNSGGWVVVGIGALAMSVVILLPRLAGRGRNQP
jgi:hypothetical protein